MDSCGGQKRLRPASKSVIQRDSPFGHPSKPIAGFFSKYPCWIHDIFLRSFSDSKCFHFIYQVDFGNRWQWLFVLSALGALNALLLGNLVGNLFPNMGLAQKEGLGVAVTMAMSFCWYDGLPRHQILDRSAHSGARKTESCQLN